jgi:hypothetical protein
MRLLDRFRTASGSSTTLSLLPDGEPGRLLLRSLGDNGFGLRDADTEEPLRADDPAVDEMGVIIATLENIGDRRDALRCTLSAPGQPLRLVPEGKGVVVYDASGEHDIGDIPADVAPDLADALRAGVGHRAVSLWEVRALDGSRSELRVLIVPSRITLIIGVDDVGDYDFGSRAGEATAS